MTSMTSLTSRDRFSSFLDHVTQVGSQVMVWIVLIMTSTASATMMLTISFITLVKTRKGSGKLIFNVHSVVVERMVQSISMIFMLNNAIEKFRIENRPEVINLSLTF